VTRSQSVSALVSRDDGFRRAVRRRGHFPNEQAAVKILYLVAHQRRPGRPNLSGKTNGWKHILNALTIHHGDRIDANH
jgi:putative transposase